MSNAANKLIQAASGNAGADPVYVDDLFSSFLYEGNGGVQGIPNGLNLGDFGAGTSTRFNGTSDYLSRSSDLTGNADGKTLTFSCWVFMPPMDNRDDGQNQRVLYATDSSDNGVNFNVDSSGYLGLEAWNGGVRTLQGTTTTKIGTNVWTHILVSMNMSNSSQRYVYFNDVAASVTWSTYNDANIEFTRSTHYIGVWGNGTARFFYDDMAHFYLDYTYRDLTTESNRRIFIDANGGSTSASSLAALNPIMYLPMTTAYAIGKNEGTGGDFTASGSPRIVENGTEYASGEGKGGMVWFGRRDDGDNRFMSDTVRGATKTLRSNTSAVESTDTSAVTSFTANGPVVGSDGSVNANDKSFCAWTFRKAEGFFDIVTWTGNGVSGREIPHNLGSVPGMILVKNLSLAADWRVFHRSLGPTKNVLLNGTNAPLTQSGMWNDTAPTSTVFTVGNDGGVNSNTSTYNYVAYVFAHNAQDFGENSDQAVVYCDSFDTSSFGTSGLEVNVGFEIQWLLYKRTDTTGDWYIMDIMRGAYPPFEGNYGQVIKVNTADAEGNQYYLGYQPTPTGFRFYSSNNQTYIYMAIGRPHKPASEFAATDLFTPALGINMNSGGDKSYATTYPVDLMFNKRFAHNEDWRVVDRIRAGYRTGHYLETNTADNEAAETYLDQFDHSDGIYSTGGRDFTDRIGYSFRRAPGFCDVVGYVGYFTNQTVGHSLGVVPELIIIKTRNGSSATYNWAVYYGDNTDYLELNKTTATTDDNTFWNDTSPTASVFTVGTSGFVNEFEKFFIAYLFASVDGISKIGTYSGTGSDVTVDCGFSSGARFVVIKRTNSTGSWYVLDSVRGITTGSDPAIIFNELNAQDTRAYIKPHSSGFIASDQYTTTISGAEYIFFAIA
tara:strand:+ start:1171 stop:3837 length:2667 start_codon:yes stop_codon:yes gene_type:complete